MGTKRKIRYTTSALRDLKGIRDFIADDSPTAAAETVIRVVDTVDHIAAHPKAGRMIPELLDEDDDTREWIVAPYRIFYRIVPDAVVIMRIRHGARLFRGWPDLLS